MNCLGGVVERGRSTSYLFTFLLFYLFTFKTLLSGKKFRELYNILVVKFC